MFDTEKFILEVQSRVCLWDAREKPDRVAKKQAWEDIAKLFYINWRDETETKQRELVEELQKKWKHLRDYYVKEKKLGNTRSGSAANKRRKNSYVEMLYFLDVAKEPRFSSGNIGSPVDDRDHELSNNINAQETIVENSGSSEIDAIPGTSQGNIKKSKMTMFQKKLIAAVNRKLQPPKVEDADSKFLLSLLPQIKSLGERQNCEFRIEVMNLIYKIKYRCPYYMDSYSSGCSSYETPPTRLKDSVKVEVDMSPSEYTASADSYSSMLAPELTENQSRDLETQ